MLPLNTSINQIMHVSDTLPAWSLRILHVCQPTCVHCHCFLCFISHKRVGGQSKIPTGQSRNNDDGTLISPTEEHNLL